MQRVVHTASSTGMLTERHHIISNIRSDEQDICSSTFAHVGSVAVPS